MYPRSINQILDAAIITALARCNKLGYKNKKYRKRVANRNKLRKREYAWE